jgi:flagellar biosynthetic protein FliQ
MQSLFIEVITRSLWVALQLAMPLLLAALISGFIIGIFQSITQIQEQTLSFVPKVLIVGIVLWTLWPSMSQTLIEFVAFGQHIIPALLKAK